MWWKFWGRPAKPGLAGGGLGAKPCSPETDDKRDKITSITMPNFAHVEEVYGQSPQKLVGVWGKTQPRS